MLILASNINDRTLHLKWLTNGWEHRTAWSTILPRNALLMQNWFDGSSGGPRGCAHPLGYFGACHFNWLSADTAWVIASKGDGGLNDPRWQCVQSEATDTQSVGQSSELHRHPNTLVTIVSFENCSLWLRTVEIRCTNVFRIIFCNLYSTVPRCIFAVGHTECYKLVDQWQKATRTMCSWLNVVTGPFRFLPKIMFLSSSRVPWARKQA